jgi:acyl-homoserine-lactone acylase
MLRNNRLIRFLLVAGFAIPWVPQAFADDVGERLAKQVEIRRTEYGVPHIKADTLEAVAFGFGYCQAEDHLLNIMNSILRARGELAENFGGDDNVESDFRNRQYQVRKRAIETYHRLDPDFRSMLEGFAGGINHYVELHRDEVPEWVPVINGHDVAAHGLTGVARFAFDRGRIVRKFLAAQNKGEASLEAKPPEDRYGQDGYGEDMFGSNMWAFAPERSKSGNALLLGNPHQGWSQVATYYEAHLTVPGILDFYGSTFVGRPVLTTGFNKNLGWSHTVNYPDLEEIYEVDRDPNRADHYLFDEGSVAVEKEVATIRVKTDDGFRTETRTFSYTPLGPVIHETDEHLFILRSAAYEEYRFYQQWLRLSQANSFAEFKSALDVHAIPMFNICYADREGNIYYLWNGTIPDIPHERKSFEAVSADDSGDIWTRFHPIGELPQLLNPKGGYVHNCNSAPYLTNAYERMNRDDFPKHFPDDRFSLRSQHSLELIHNEARFDLEQIVEMKHSQRMLLAERVKDDLVSAIRDSNPDQSAKQAADILEKWDNTVAASTRGSALFETWWKIYSKDGRGGFTVEWSADKPTSTPHGLNEKDWAAEAFDMAIAQMEKEHGDWDVTWGDVHRVRRGKLDLPVSGGSGLMGCFRVVAFKQAEDKKHVVSGGDSWVFAVEFAESPRAYTIVGYSQSEVEGTPHFDDQAKLYSENRMKKAAFTEAEIDQQLLSTYHPGEEK